MNEIKKQLVLSAMELVQIGERLEKARADLKRLAESGVPTASDEMKEALQACLALKLQWQALEQRHLELKQKLEERCAEGKR